MIEVNTLKALVDAAPVEDVEIDRLFIHKNNRHPKQKDPEIKELANSILAAGGILHPLLVRPAGSLVYSQQNTGSTDRSYEICSGARRMVAATSLGHSTVPARCVPMSDRDFGILLLVENLQREDMDPFIEAKQIEELQKRGDLAKASEVAELLGKDAAWVGKRLALSRLNKAWKKQYLQEDHNWTIDHILLIARQTHEIQDKLFDLLTMDETVSEIRRMIASQLCKLSSAPFSLTKIGLNNKAPACSECPDRSDVSPDLFQEFEEESKKGSLVAMCLLPQCFSAKCSSVAYAKVMDVRRENPDVLVIQRPNATIPVQVAGKVHDYGISKAKKEETSVDAIILDDMGRATRQRVTVDTGTYGHAAEAAIAAQNKAKKEASKSVTEAEEDLDPKDAASMLTTRLTGKLQLIWREVMEELKTHLVETDGPPENYPIHNQGLLNWALSFGLGYRESNADMKDWENLDSRAESDGAAARGGTHASHEGHARAEEALPSAQHMWDTQKWILAGRLHSGGSASGTMNGVQMYQMGRIADLTGFNLAESYQTWTKERPLPKTWVNKYGASKLKSTRTRLEKKFLKAIETGAKV